MRAVNNQYGTHAQNFLDTFHASTIEGLIQATEKHDVVVIGMFLNPHVKSVRKALDQANIPYHYMEYGGYFSKWKQRLAIKMWSGWPTFPQVFVKGTLIGGNQCTRKALKEGSIAQILNNT